MKYVALLSALSVSGLLSLSARAAEPVPGAAIPDRPSQNVLMIYSVHPAKECYRAAQSGTDLRLGLEHCNIAMRDPMLNYRAQTVVNRGIVRFGLGDPNGALADFDNALNYNPGYGDAYLNRAQVLVAQKRSDDAMAAINQGIALGATNLHVAYYVRGEIEDDAGQYTLAYRDYRQALRIKPGYAPAESQLTRFKAVPAKKAAS
jgi:tetratricopeptide (TPR) repeat protein